MYIQVLQNNTFVKIYLPHSQIFCFHCSLHLPKSNIYYEYLLAVPAIILKHITLVMSGVDELWKTLKQI